MSTRFWYRHEDLYEGLTLRQYPVLKETAKGAWLDVYGERRFALKDCRKRFACPTEKEALQSYIARKKRQIKILKNQLDKAEQRLYAAQHGVVTPALFGDAFNLELV